MLREIDIENTGLCWLKIFLQPEWKGKNQFYQMLEVNLEDLYRLELLTGRILCIGKKEFRVFRSVDLEMYDLKITEDIQGIPFLHVLNMGSEKYRTCG